MGRSLVEVAVPLPVDRTFTYRVPEGRDAEAALGRRVTVPFGRRDELRGFIVGHPDETEIEDLKEVREFLDEGPVLGEDILALCRFVSRYYGCSLGESLDAALPSGVKHGRASRTVAHAELAVAPEEARARADALPDSRAKQARILTLLADEPEPVPVTDLLRRSRASRSPVSTLARAGLVRIRRLKVPDDPFGPPEDPPRPPPVLTGEQAAAVEAVSAAARDGEFAVFLLFGVTGSGKTEVYLRSIREAVDRGRQAIVLVPEISLTPQTVRRFRERFSRVAVLHSAQSEAERRRWWKAAQRGEVDVVVGPRSAVFAPLPMLGLVVVDEEHDSSFKQGRSPRYHARDVAVVRAHHSGAAVILGSATPSLESWHNARRGKYRLLTLSTRVGGGELPPVEIVDMALEMEETKSFTHFSRRLKAVVRESLERGEQTMLFLNRRGFSTLLLCRRCGESLTCDRCSVTLTYHQRLGRAVCHLCGHLKTVPPDCPKCAQPGLLHRGFGTEKIEEEIASHYPDARVARMDSDTMTSRTSYERVLDGVRRKELDILVGTQMIAKGLHFPDVTAVGVVDADTSLRIPDFRAAERTFQLIAQVAGRTGRSERGGRVVVQTYRKDQPALLAAAAHDYRAFAEEELHHREALGYPPFGRILLVVVRGKRAGTVASRSHEVVRRLRERLDPDRATVLGPAVPPIERIKDRVHRQIVVKADGPQEIARAVALLRAERAGGRGGAEVVLDVDPVGMM
ncbi:MAG: replication restart helicase PriA [Planctomycetota bacterium]|jgi:primosomal protein N' (replication factor Y)